MTFKELENIYRETSSEQFSTFIHNIVKIKNTGEMNLLGLSTALCQIADSEVEECRRIIKKGKDMDEAERQYLAISTQLLACILVLLCESRSKNETRSKSLLFLEYSSCLNSNRYDFTELAINCGCYAMLNPGFSLSMIENSISTDVLIYKMLEHAEFDRKHKLEGITMDGAGSICLADGKLHVSSAKSWDSDIPAFSCHNGTVEVYTRNIRDERLKESNIDDILAVESFAATFIKAQGESRKVKPKKMIKGMVLNERYSIILGQKKNDDGLDYLECIPMLDVPYEDTCELKEEELVKGIYTNELIEYLYEEDVIGNAELVDEEEPALFSIREAYKTYCVKIAEADAAKKRVYEAKVIGFFRGSTPDKDRVRLISDKGYAGLMRVNGNYRKGDIIIVHTASIKQSGDDTYINMDIPAFSYEDEPGRFDGESILGDFITVKDAIASSEEKSEPADSSFHINKSIIKSISAIITASRSESSMDRLRSMLCSAFMLNVIDDAEGRDTILAQAEFFSQCLRTAENIPVRSSGTRFRLNEKETWIINALGFLGKPDDSKGIASLIRNANDEDEMNIAELLMVHSLSISFPDDLRCTSEDIRKRICTVLGVEDHFRGPECKGGGKYGKGELADVEFKASYVMSNRDGKPDLYNQGRGQVFEAVCGFMNRNGGTVYIGVNDYGDPLTAEGYGIKGDLDWFRKNFDAVKLLRSKQLHHPVPQPVDLDSYCRFLNDEMELYFKPSVRNCVTISPTEDMDAIRIDVEPSEFEIVKLYEDNTWTNGTVYVRNGEETVPMSRHEQEQRLMKSRSVGKVEQFIITLTEAIDRKHKVILKGYSSSNSNEVRDRFVVPINLVCNNENLWAYDLEKKKPKEFRLSRISSIDTNVNDAEYNHAYKKGESDVFRWIDPEVNYHIKLKMSIAALNCLREEYSDTKNLPETELYQVSPERWILDTTLHGLGAVRRFYLGLADQIEIMDTEDADKLREEIRIFMKKNLEHLNEISIEKTYTSEPSSSENIKRTNGGNS